MTIPASWKGRSRVVLDKITPCIGDGSFPIRRVLQDRLEVHAHAFADGHDKLAVFLLYKEPGSRKFERYRMEPLGNDEFAASIQLTTLGIGEYSVEGMIDHFQSWHDGFIKKHESGQDMAVELQIGAALIEEAAERARKIEARTLLRWAGKLADADLKVEDRIKLVLDPKLLELMLEHPNKDLATRWTPNCKVAVERKKALFSTWFEYFPRSCADDGKRHGTFKDAEKRLPEIAAMGFDVVYFPPIHPIGKVKRKGRNNALEAGPDDPGSPWAIGSAEGGHKSIHKELGTERDFRNFMRAAERYGIEVALDIAFQCAPDHPYVKEHPSWFKWRPDGSVQYAENPPKKYEDILPINFETEDWQELWEELLAVFLHWIELGVKIFRVDNPHTKPMEFWRWLIGTIKEDHPEVIFLSEAFTRPKRMYRLAKAGFTQSYTYFTWRNSGPELREYLESMLTTDVKEYFYPNFWPNTPDILHAELQTGNRNTFIGRYVLAGTLSSNMGCYGPAYQVLDCEPFPGKEEYNNNEKYQFKQWDWQAPGNICEEMARLNRIRHDHPALQETYNIRFLDTDNRALLAYWKTTEDRTDQILVVVNMDWHHEQWGHVFLPLDAMHLSADPGFAVQDLFDPAKPIYRWNSNRNFIKLSPEKSPAHIFRILH